MITRLNRGSARVVEHTDITQSRGLTARRYRPERSRINQCWSSEIPADTVQEMMPDETYYTRPTIYLWQLQ